MKFSRVVTNTILAALALLVGSAIASEADSKAKSSQHETLARDEHDRVILRGSYAKASFYTGQSEEKIKQLLGGSLALGRGTYLPSEFMPDSRGNRDDYYPCMIDGKEHLLKVTFHNHTIKTVAFLAPIVEERDKNIKTVIITEGDSHYKERPFSKVNRTTKSSKSLRQTK